jgi:phage terminase large subunit
MPRLSKQIPENAEPHILRETHRQKRGLQAAEELVSIGVEKDINIETTVVYHYLENSDKEITILQGGARSGKTMNSLIWFCVKLMSEENKILSICRASLPTIRGTILRDFKEVMLKLGIWDDNRFNQTQLIYEMGSNTIEFISTDQPQKIRGRKRNYLYMNEANEIEKEAAMQLILRTTEKTVLDYNPSDEDGWFYDWADKPESDFYITTYKDNPYLEPSLIKRIESMQQADDNYWRVFGLGLRGVSLHKIFTHWKPVPRIPDDVDEIVYGVDFGFNSPSAVTRVGIKDDRIFLSEVIYEKGLTTQDLMVRMAAEGVNKDDILYCDAAAAESIEELIRGGWNANKADKDVLEGIRKMKSMPMYVTDYSTNFIGELRGYCWKLDKNGTPLDEPVKYKDHLIDAARYAVFTHVKSDQIEWFVI